MRTEIDGIKFDSKAEAEYYFELKLRERAGQIKILEIQPAVYMTDARILYRADFLIEEDGVKKYIDVKGVETPVFKLKKKLWVYYGMGILQIVSKEKFGFTSIQVRTKESR